MPSALSKRQAASVEDAADVPETSYDAQRERLIDDLALLVVRQHQHQQRATSGNDPTSASTEVATK